MKSQQNTPLLTALIDYIEKDVTPFDVPGHKYGQGNPQLREFLGNQTLRADVNSMKPLDNILNPIGVIKEAEILMAEAYHADYAFFLVNGTTSGVQGMIMAVCNPCEKIIIPRNVHKSAINALILSGAKPVYVQPEVSHDLGIANGVTLDSIKEAINKNKDAKAVFIINPTYYGVTSDLKEIIRLAHENNMLVLVDEAHGSHFPFHNDFPNSAMSLGADMSAISLHKTGGSLTQSSALLINEERVSRDKIKTILNLTQTTSASYLLMVSLDIARKRLATEGKRAFDRVLSLARYARQKINNIEGLYAFGKEMINESGVIDFDESKLGINVFGLGITGLKVYDILRDEYNIQVEFGDTYNILAIISLGDTEKSINTLIKALEDIAKKYICERKIMLYKNLCNPEVVLSPREAFFADKKIVDIKDAVGHVSGEFVMMYPPGIPIIAPGERITDKIIKYIEFLKSEEGILTGLEDQNVEKIKIIHKKNHC